MNSETIEENYQKALADAEKIFSDGIKNKKNLATLEKNYKNTVRKAREIYNKNLSKWIKKPKEKIKKKKVKEKKIGNLDVKKRDFELNIFQKSKYTLSLFFFKVRFKIHNIIHGNTPDPVAYQYIKAKFHTKRNLKKLKNTSVKAKESTEKNLGILWTSLKKGLKNSYKWIFEFPGKILSKFRKKKTDEKGEKEAKKDSKDEEKEEQ